MTNEDRQTEQQFKINNSIEGVTGIEINPGKAQQKSNRGEDQDDAETKGSMKGLKILKALPSNAIDLYPMMVDAAAEGVYIDGPRGRELRNYYFGGLLKELASDYHFWFLARRGRGFLGYIHGVVIPGRWNGNFDTLAVDMVFVTKHRRKNGIAKKLIDEIIKEAENIGVTKIDFICPESQVEHWMKTRKAAKVANLMRINL